MSMAEPNFFFSVPTGLTDGRDAFELIDWAYGLADESLYTYVSVMNNPQDSGLALFARVKGLTALEFVQRELWISPLDEQVTLRRIAHALSIVIEAAANAIASHDFADLEFLLCYCGALPDGGEGMARRASELRRALESMPPSEISVLDDEGNEWATLAYVRALRRVVEDSIQKKRQFVYVGRRF